MRENQKPAEFRDLMRLIPERKAEIKQSIETALKALPQSVKAALVSASEDELIYKVKMMKASESFLTINAMLVSDCAGRKNYAPVVEFISGNGAVRKEFQLFGLSQAELTEKVNQQIRYFQDLDVREKSPGGSRHKAPKAKKMTVGE